MEGKWTPGPWRISAPDETLILADNGDVATTFRDHDDYEESYARRAADARLIAEAPAMVAVLMRWQGAMWASGISPVKDSNDPIEALLFDTVTALARARGENAEADKS